MATVRSRRRVAALKRSSLNFRHEPPDPPQRHPGKNSPLPSRRRHEPDRKGLRLFGQGPPGADAPLRRALSLPPPRSRRHSGRHEDGHRLDRLRVSFTTRSKTPTPPSRRSRRIFGPEIAALVDGLTKISKMTLTTREEQQAENFRKMLLAMAKDIRIVIIKLADRLHNMRTLESPAPRKPDQDRPGNPRYLRPPRQPAGHRPDQDRAGGPRLSLPPSR